MAATSKPGKELIEQLAYDLDPSGMKNGNPDNVCADGCCGQSSFGSPRTASPKAAQKAGFRLCCLGSGVLKYLLLGIGTHKLTRIIARDQVTAPFRAPFTRFEKFAGSGEVEENAHGSGLRGAIGELVSCSYCMSGSPNTTP